MGVMIKKPEDVPGSAVPAILIGLFVSFGGILFGYIRRWILSSRCSLANEE